MVEEFETMDLPLTRRKKKNKRVSFVVCFAVSLLPDNYKTVGRKCRVSVLLFRSDVYVTSPPFFYCSFLSSVMID